MSFIYQFRHEAVEQGEQKRGNMRSVHIRIRHNNNLVIPQLGDIKIISIALGKTAAKGIDHCFDLRICKNFINTCFFHIQNLTANGQNCLKCTISCSFCASSCGIPLYNKNLAFGSIPRFAVRQFSIGIEGKLLFCKHICFRFFFRLPYLCRLFRTADYGL